ncbi:MAG TPA: hypothetical protein VEY71_10955 [Chitinophagales bacterium]|nr:hypothetical protein [Chitinophagales bacterium]
MNDNDVSKRYQTMMGIRFIKGIIIALVAAAFFALVVFALMYCWNYVMPGVFGLPMISFWQALALFIVSKILLWNNWRGGRRNWGPPQHVREMWANRTGPRMQNMTPEEKERIKKYWEHKCGKRFGSGWSGEKTENSNEQTQA